ncbi:hypothetical protein [Chitinophaga terrae (ex Kim and Jung 2007)]|nr:hypothetical protein [Chitinophaga terrae (ex Kim and Jung 2007)]MDQ0109104.1 hypothetical protein [Chitinophaga terrae (ex Kim and Jung 2007)]
MSDFDKEISIEVHMKCENITFFHKIRSVRVLLRICDCILCRNPVS